MKFKIYMNHYILLFGLVILCVGLYIYSNTRSEGFQDSDELKPIVDKLNSLYSVGFNSNSDNEVLESNLRAYRNITGMDFVYDPNTPPTSATTTPPTPLPTPTVEKGEKGDPGEKGEKGDPGEKGEKGETDNSSLDIISNKIDNLSSNFKNILTINSMTNSKLMKSVKQLENRMEMQDIQKQQSNKFSENIVSPVSVIPFLNESTKSKMKPSLKGMKKSIEPSTETSMPRTFPADYSSYTSSSESRSPIVDEKTESTQQALNARTFARESPENSLIDLMKQQNENIGKLLSRSSTVSENSSSTDSGDMSDKALVNSSIQEYINPIGTEFVRPVLPPPESSTTESYQNPSVLQGVEYKKLSLFRK